MILVKAQRLKGNLCTEGKKKKTASAAPSDERVRNTFIVQIVLSIYHQRLLQDY